MRAPRRKQIFLMAFFDSKFRGSKAEQIGFFLCFAEIRLHSYAVNHLKTEGEAQQHSKSVKGMVTSFPAQCNVELPVGSE